MRVWLVVAATLLTCFGAIERTAEACSKAHQTPFELVDAAAHVAVARVVSTPKKVGVGAPAGWVHLRIVTPVRGAEGRKLRARVSNTSCHAGMFRTGRTGLVFIGADGLPVGAYEGFIDFHRFHDRKGFDPGVLVRRLEAYLAAGTSEDRAAVLVAAIVDGGAWLASEAAFELTDRPDLLRVLDAAQREQLIEAVGRSEAPTSLFYLVARLHDLRAADALVRRMESSSYTGIADANAALAVLTLYEVERVWGVFAAGRRDHLVASWKKWLAPRRSWSPERVLREGLGATYDPSLEGDAARRALAVIIGAGTSRVARIGALELCELAAGKRIYRFSRYSRGVAEHFWTTLADACRAGEPVFP